MESAPWRARPVLWLVLLVYGALVLGGAGILVAHTAEPSRAIAVLIPGLMILLLGLAMLTQHGHWTGAQRVAFVAVSLAGTAAMTLFLGLGVLPALGASPPLGVAVGGLLASLPWVFLGLWESTLFARRSEPPLLP